MPGPRTDTPARVPWLSLLLGYGPAMVIALLALAAWLGFDPALPLARAWAAAILIFLGGVTRGLSFFTQGGPRVRQLAVMLGRFVCGFLALLVPLAWAFPLLALGYLSALLYDPVAAHEGEAPRFFASLRPPQMFLALTGLAILAVVAFLRA